MNGFCFCPVFAASMLYCMDVEVMCVKQKNNGSFYLQFNIVPDS